MSSHQTSCYLISCHLTPCHIIKCSVTPCHPTPSHPISPHPISSHPISPHDTGVCCRRLKLDVCEVLILHVHLSSPKAPKCGNIASCSLCDVIIPGYSLLSLLRLPWVIVEYFKICICLKPNALLWLHETLLSLTALLSVSPCRLLSNRSMSRSSNLILW